MTFIYNCWKVFLESVFDFYLQLLESVNPNHNHLFDIQWNATAFMLNQLSFFFPIKIFHQKVRFFPLKIYLMNCSLYEKFMVGFESLMVR